LRAGASAITMGTQRPDDAEDAVTNSGLVINAFWLIASAVNFLLLIGVIVGLTYVVIRLFRWVSASRRHDREIASLRGRVARLEGSDPVDPSSD
jgi:Flp pilus assembly protein TadB